MRHVLFELRGCPSELLDDLEFCKLALQIAASKSKSKLIDVTAHKFEPQGVTGLALLADSHISIHTWPEDGLAMCDIFTCSVDADPIEAVQYLKRQYKSTNTTFTQHVRE
jgi:S-adenosylmethionine decarboxylase|tara:strand:+ start:27 stop:356 length:330 start_codon:yes stop_codon:yes gene_type:complete